MDGHPSLERGWTEPRLQAGSPSPPWTNVLAGVKRNNTHTVIAAIHTIFAQPDATSLREQFDRIVARASFLTSPVWKGAPGEWTRMAIAQIRYEGDGSWTLYFGDRHGKWTEYFDLDSNQPRALDAGIKIETGW